MRTTKPLRGHPYHGKSDHELQYIMADAREAADAVRTHDPKAEAKYLDQINDACTVLRYRSTLKNRPPYFGPVPLSERI